MQRIFRTLATAMGLGLASGATVLAADVARPVYKAPPPAPVAPYSWTGFYVGIHGGGAWFDKDWFYPCSATNLLIRWGRAILSQGGHSGSSWLAGGRIGFNYQVGQWVWGIEAQFSATRIKGDNLDIAFPTQERLHSRTDFIGTMAPRLGLGLGSGAALCQRWGRLGARRLLADGGAGSRCGNDIRDGERNALGLDGRRRHRVRPCAKLVRQGRIQLFGFWNQAHFLHQHRRGADTASIRRGHRTKDLYRQSGPELQVQLGRAGRCEILSAPSPETIGQSDQSQRSASLSRVFPSRVQVLLRVRPDVRFAHPDALEGAAAHRHQHRSHSRNGSAVPIDARSATRRRRASLTSSR